MASVLVIEDDLTFSRILEGFLSKHGHSVKANHTGKDGLKTFTSKEFDVVLLDYRLPDINGLNLLTDLRTHAPHVPVIIMTSFNDLRTAVKAVKAGAFEYITKPVNPEELLMILNQSLKTETKPVKKVAASSPKDFIEGKSEVSRKLHEYIYLVAPTDMSVIIEGESGTGKEYVARTIHRISRRNKAPFIAVDCGALSKDLAASELFGHVKGAFTGAVSDKVGQFEAANGGTLFLDEVGNLSYEVQVKLLRAIQERTISPLGSNKEIKVDVRIITATNDDLVENVRMGKFREDLYHRLNEFKMRVPSLKERKTDLLEFVDHFRQSANADLGKDTLGFSQEVIDIFRSYDWPGNLRELKNVVKRAVLLSQEEIIHSNTLSPEMLEAVRQPSVAIASPAPMVLPNENMYDLKALQESQERELIIKTLHEVRYNKSKAARILNIDRKTLYLKMEKYGIQ
jgi:two-component system, NtrC family, response regulator HydG